jgi:hypothetical protein
LKKRNAAEKGVSGERKTALPENAELSSRQLILRAPGPIAFWSLVVHVDDGEGRV